MTLETAKEIARNYVLTQSATDGEEFVLVDERTLEKPYGWVFFYETRAFVETGDELTRAVGNAPFLVEAESGEIHVSGSDRPIEEYLRLFELYGAFHREQGAIR